MVVDDRLGLGELMIELDGRFALQQKIFVEERFHGVW
jgi:hypothetical protein